MIWLISTSSYSTGSIFGQIDFRTLTPGKRKEVWTTFLHQVVALSLYYLQTGNDTGAFMHRDVRTHKAQWPKNAISDKMIVFRNLAAETNESIQQPSD